MSDFSDEFEELKALMTVTTFNLKRMQKLQKHLHIQFGANSLVYDLEDELKATLDGWIASNC